MKTAVAILFLLLLLSSADAQFYLRGEIRDEKNTPLSNAKIVQHSTGYIYYSGSSGAFGIMSSKAVDSFTVSLEGYQTISINLETSKFQSLVLKTLYSTGNVQRNHLMSLTRNLKLEDKKNWTVGGETYSSLMENGFVNAQRNPETGFAIHTDKASYSNVRRFLNMNTQVPPDAVRTEEMLNYFNFEYVPPPKDSVFGFQSYVSDCPWNANSQLLFLHVCARKVDPGKIPPSNLVFLIDISGSMDMPNRLPLLKSAFKLLVDNLRDQDTVSIVVYGSTVGIWLTPTSGKEKDKIRKAIEELYPGGATAGESGIRTAYQLAKSQYIKGGNNRVILATDGDFNVGQSSDDELENIITQHQKWGIYLTCLGVGMGNYKDSKLEVLAKKGNGNFAYLDDEREAEKVLVKELTQTLYSVADNTYMNIWINPSVIRQYRLIGFDNKLKALADTLNDVEGGEVGSGHSMMAIFEITPINEGASGQFYEKDGIAKVAVSYRLPNDSIQLETSYRCPNTFTSFDDLPGSYRFASAVAMFAALLKDSKYTPRITWNDIFMVAKDSMNPSDEVQQEFLTMVTKAKKVYGKSKRKKKETE